MEHFEMRDADYLGCISRFLVQDEKGFSIIVKLQEFWSNYSSGIRWGNIPGIW